ncbi:unnamed protein product [Caenorhabditis sp. 36 PRJEB53466]|nr:unnamed protein product [Caenorhabditis sp. 36 PRJEB53466]
MNAEKNYTRIMTYKVFENMTTQEWTHNSISKFTKYQPQLDVFLVQYNDLKRVALVSGTELNNCETDETDCPEYAYDDINTIFYFMCWDKSKNKNGFYGDYICEEKLT